MSKPIAVLISDIHFTINTLEEAAASFLKAQFKAKILDVPLIVCGDTLDSKAIMRAECVNKLLELVPVKDAPEMIFLVGNHDKVNEKSKEHTLNFLKPYAVVVEESQLGHLSDTKVLLLPYQHDATQIRKLIYSHLYDYDESPGVEPWIPAIIIMHQGVIGSTAGHYIQDKSAVPKEELAGFRVISGHYHTRQTFDLPDGGQMTYLGNPYTLGFGEANDPEKGYHILNSDGSLEFISTDLRKHVIIECTISDTFNVEKYPKATAQDKVWLKLKGNKELLNLYSKEVIAKTLFIKGEFKLTLHPNDTESTISVENIKDSQPELLDNLIQSLTNVSDEQKERLKSIWKDIVE